MHLQMLRDDLDTLVMDADVLESLLDSREPTVMLLRNRIVTSGAKVSRRSIMNINFKH